MSREAVPIEAQAKQRKLALVERARSLPRFWGLLVGLVAALVAAIVLGVGIGAVPVATDHVLGIIFTHLSGAPVGSGTRVEDLIIWQFRLPRVLLAAVVGASLAVGGTALQALVRNPLADPYLLGISSGASVGAVAVLTLGPLAVGSLSVSTAAFLGALGAMLVVYLLAQQAGRVAPQSLILAGVAVGYALSAVTSFLVLRSTRPGGGVAGVLRWLAGTLADASWGDLGLPSVVLVVVTGWLILQSRPLNALLAGDETATTLGINLWQFRLMLFAVTSLLVGVAVALSGAIGFVGLMIPHMVRLFVGANHRRVLPLAALLGAVFLVLADLLGRVILAPQELPVGLVTAAVGGPFFLWLLRARRARGGIV